MGRLTIHSFKHGYNNPAPGIEHQSNTKGTGQRQPAGLNSTQVQMAKATTIQLPVIGWREWIELPDLGIRRIKAKVDTGARSSSLHAYSLETFEQAGQEYVRFKVHPQQRKTDEVVEAVAKILEYRSVRSSSGKAAMRPVIITNVVLLGLTWPVELTLANRDAMGFRMLLGREAFRRRFLVDAGRSYRGGRAKKKKKKKRA